MGISDKISQALLDYGKTIDPQELFPVVIPEAEGFAISTPFGFALATSLNRGTRADIIWTIPYDIHQNLGHLDPGWFSTVTINDLADLFSRLPRKPRYINNAPRTVKELTQIVVDEFNGDASGIWINRPAHAVTKTFQSIFGVGTGIANMSVLLIEKAYGIRFSDLDRPHMDIKADVHTKRVLYRLGVSLEQTENSAIKAARRMSPEYPGELDAPLWVIGRKWCHALNPMCVDCPMFVNCQKAGIE